MLKFLYVLLKQNSEPEDSFIKFLLILSEQKESPWKHLYIFFLC